MTLTGKTGSTMGITFAVGGAVGSTPLVAAVMKKSPAGAAGVQVGDALISISGTKRLLGIGAKKAPAALQWFVGAFSLTVASHGSGSAASALEAEAAGATEDDAMYEPMVAPPDGGGDGDGDGDEAGEMYSTMDHGGDGGDIYSTMDDGGDGGDGADNVYGNADEADEETGGVFSRMKRSFKKSFRRSARKGSGQPKADMTHAQIEAALRNMIDEIREVEITKEEGHELDVELGLLTDMNYTDEHGEEAELNGLVRVSEINRHKCSDDVVGLDQLKVGDIMVSISGKINLLNKSAAEIAAVFDWFTDNDTPVELTWGDAAEPTPDGMGKAEGGDGDGAEPAASDDDAPASSGGGAGSLDTPFFHGALQKEAADLLLLADDGASTSGKFLFRSNKASPNEFILSVIYQGTATHHTVVRTGDGEEFALNKDPTGQSTLADLAEWLRETRPAWPVALTEGVTFEGGDAAAAAPEPETEPPKAAESEPEPEPEPEKLDEKRLCILNDRREANVVIMMAGDNIGINLEVVEDVEDATGVVGIASFIRITEVGDGLSGEKAGLSVGEIIESVEGTPLWGLDLPAVGALFKDHPSGFQLVVGSSISAVPSDEPEQEEPPAEAAADAAVDDAAEVLADYEMPDGFSESTPPETPVNHGDAYADLTDGENDAPYDISGLRSQEINLVGKHKCAGIKFAKVKAGSTRPPKVASLAKKSAAAEAGVEADAVLVSIQGSKSLLGVGIEVATAAIQKYGGSLTLTVASRNEVDPFADEVYENVNSDGEAQNVNSDGEATSKDDNEDATIAGFGDAEEDDGEDEGGEGEDEGGDGGPKRRKSVEELGEDWAFANGGGEYDDHVVLPADRVLSAADKETRRLTQRQGHEEILKEVRAERQVQRRQSLMKVQTALRRVVVLENETKAEPAKLVNPFLEQFGVKKTKAPNVRWSNDKKVGRVVHLKEGEDVPEGAIDLPEQITPLERTTMEKKYNFTFLETMTEEEFGFHYATDEDIEEEDVSFVPFDERKFQDEKDAMRLRMGVEEFAAWEIEEDTRVERETKQLAEEAAAKAAADEAERVRLEEEAAAAKAAADAADRVRLEEEAAAKDAEEKRLAKEKSAAKKAKKAAAVQEALAKADAFKSADVAAVATTTEVEQVAGKITTEHLGTRVAVKGVDGTGVLRFVGLHHTTGKERCGVELDAAADNFTMHNGTVKGHRYFECPEDRGILVPPGHISLTNNTYDAGVPMHAKEKALEAMQQRDAAAAAAAAVGDAAGSDAASEAISKPEAPVPAKGANAAVNSSLSNAGSDVAASGDADYSSLGRLKLVKLAKERGLDYKPVSKDLPALRRLLRTSDLAAGGGASEPSNPEKMEQTAAEKTETTVVETGGTEATSPEGKGTEKKKKKKKKKEATAADGTEVGAASPEGQGAEKKKKKKKKKEEEEGEVGAAEGDGAGAASPGEKKKKTKKKETAAAEGNVAEPETVPASSEGQSVEKKKKKKKKAVVGSDSTGADAGAGAGAGAGGSDEAKEKPKKKKKKSKKTDGEKAAGETN